jgi:hypothetical protein
VGSAIERQVEATGLRFAGVLGANDVKPSGLPVETRALVLLGSFAGTFWDAFEAWSLQHQADTTAHPLDDFTRELVAPLVEALGAHAVYPSDGPPFWPFQSWAARVERVFPSPLKILIHPEFGLWHAYRAALLFDSLDGLPDVGVAPAALSSCLGCSGQPCLTACPVDAYDQDVFNAHACADFVTHRGSRGTDGCAARRACPVGVDNQYSKAQQQFHLRSFLRARAAYSSS